MFSQPMKKGNILVVATTFPRWKNDPEPSFVYDLSKRLAQTYDVTVLVPHYPGAKKYEVMEGMKVHRFVYFIPKYERLCYDGGIIPNMKAGFLAKMQMPLLINSEFFAAFKLLKKEKMSLIHAHWILPQGFVGVFLKNIFKVPLLVTIHGSDLFPLKNPVFKNLQKFVVENVNAEKRFFERFKGKDIQKRGGGGRHKHK